MLAVEIALGVAGGLLLAKIGRKVVDYPQWRAEQKAHERHHREFIEGLVSVAERAEAAAREAMSQKPARRKPAAKKPVTKKAPVKKQPVTKKGAANVKPAKARK